MRASGRGVGKVGRGKLRVHRLMVTGVGYRVEVKDAGTEGACRALSLGFTRRPVVVAIPPVVSVRRTRNARYLERAVENTAYVEVLGWRVDRIRALWWPGIYTGHGVQCRTLGRSARKLVPRKDEQ